MANKAASEFTLEYILRYIRKNKLGPGDNLPGELVLAERVGVGRSSIREALVTLKTMGIIQSKRKGGIKILRDPAFIELRSYFTNSYDNLYIYKEALTFRAIIEWGIAEIIFTKIKSEEIDKLKNIIKKLEADNTGKFTVEDADKLFHTELVKDCENKLAIILIQLYSPIFSYKLPQLPNGQYASQPIEGWVKEHSELIFALEHRDKKRFLELLHKHIAGYFY